ncbi:P-loop containing nucleoside triphosphate hydrolase protein [Auricularia subglabra TFB-10046 SS5]|nr:P-loop containing nucleoside triphosphate hydrolase protein [Auricularia subglabra TFB-10046 SS5]
MRTWSQGSLDIRPPPENALINRPDPRAGAAKRGSVVGLLRRDSSGMLDAAGDNWAGSSPRDGGPTISKWENLPILPELLRSIAKYGVGPPNKIQQRALPFLLRGADIIAQAPPTQERIAAYVIPAIQIALTCIANKPITRGPIVVIISTTVDQATQAQRMIRDLGGPIGVRSALGVGSAVGSNEVANEIRIMQQNMPHVLCGTPQKLHAMFTNSQPLPASEVRLLVLDEVDQLIARNLHEFVFNIVKLLPPPRSRPLPPANNSPVPGSQLPFGAGPFEPGTSPSIASPFQTQPRRFPSGVVSPGLSESPSSVGPIGSAPGSLLAPSSSPPPVERQTALFSNTVPQDVLNLATTIQLREPVRVLVRRDGNVTHADTSNGARGLRQFYLYLAFTAGGGRLDGAATPGGGLGIIGSGRGTSSAETTQAREWKLEALADLFDDVEVAQAIVHVGGITALDSVVYKLASRGIDAIPLHGDMAPGAKLAALNKFRATNSHIMRQTTKALVVYDVQVKSPDVFQVPLVINYDLPKAVEEYAHRVAPAISSNYARAGVVVNFVTATGGDVEMLRSIECFYKCPEVPMSLRDVI